jgi:methylisocitrate lyase
MKATARLRQLLNGGPVLSVGVFDCVSVIIAERQGFQMVSISGAAVTASILGYPDLGLMTMSEAVNHARHIARSTAVPVMVDADTGYGNALNVMRTVREFEDAGLAGLSIEDQVFPKRCGHYDGIALIPVEEMEVKIAAACEARRDPEFVVMARTDARSVEGLDAAIDRARRYVAAGADIIFVESLYSEEEMREAVASVPRPLKINMIEGGNTPHLSYRKLFEVGFRLVNFSGTLQRASMKAMAVAAETLREDGVTTNLYPERMVNVAERSEIMRLNEFYELEERLYGPLRRNEKSWRGELQDAAATHRSPSKSSRLL